MASSCPLLCPCQRHQDDAAASSLVSPHPLAPDSPFFTGLPWVPQALLIRLQGTPTPSAWDHRFYSPTPSNFLLLF